MRRWGAAAAVYGVLACALLLPLATRFGSAFPHDTGDPVLNTWILWWSTRELPLTAAWWNAPMFHPMTSALALSELLVGLLPITAVVQALTGNPVAAYNAAFALSFPLCGLATCLLARELTGRQDAAIVAGLVFMLAPYRMQQLSHLQVLSYYWAPVVLFALHRYAREPRRRWLVLFGAAWLAQSLTNGYAMFHLSVLVVLWVFWFMRPLRRSLPILAAWACAALPLIPVLWRYRTVHDSLHLVRDITEIRRFGADLADFFAAAPDLLIWGGRLGLARPEAALFPGITLLAMAAVAFVLTWRRDGALPAEAPSRWHRPLVLVSLVAAVVAFSVVLVGPWAVGPLTVGNFYKPFTIAVGARIAAFLTGPWVRRHWRDQSLVGFYVLATAAMYLLALGPEPRLLGRPLLYEPPYAWLMRLPGFDVLRVPARFVMLALLCEAALVALALDSWARGRRRALVMALVAGGLVLDGWARLPAAAAPAPAPAAWRDVDAIVELPLGTPDADFGAIYRSMQHGRPIVNGYSGYAPPHYLPLAHAIRDGQYAAIAEPSTGTIGVAIDRTRGDGSTLERGLEQLGLQPPVRHDNWTMFLMPGRPTPPRPLGAPIGLAGVHASLKGGDVGRMLDGDVRTAWGTGLPQIGGEEVMLDLGSEHPIGAVVLDMGAFSFGHPRLLDVELSSDGRTWRRAWSGETSVLAVRGAIAQPERAPLTIGIDGGQTARYIRLRQNGNEPGIPWWIADVRVHAPAA